jgi:hypothetical protein
MEGVVAILYASTPPDRRHDRAMRHVSAPDHHGHMRWLGPIPLNAGPHVQYQGTRIPAAHYLWLRADRPAIFPLVRTCHDPQCISPDHHALASAPSAVAAIALTHADLAAFDLARPPINPRPKRWDRTDPTRALCNRAGHPLKIYGDPRLKRTYCRLCAYDERKRLRDRSSIEARILQAAYGAGRTTLPELEDVPDGPTLVDQLLASGAWDA